MQGPSYFLFRYGWITVLYSSQVYNTVFRNLNTKWNDHHNKPSYCLSPGKVITILLTILCYILYTLCYMPWFTVLLEVYCPLVPFSCFAQSPTLSPAGSHQCVLCVYEFISPSCFGFTFTWKQTHTQYLSFSGWLISSV